LNTISGYSTFLAALALTYMENLCFCLNEHNPNERSTIGCYKMVLIFR